MADDHPPYQECGDKHCDRYGCVAFKIGYSDYGYPDGYSDGYNAGVADGYAAGHADGAASAE